MAFQRPDGRGKTAGSCLRCGKAFVGQRNRRYCSMNCAVRPWEHRTRAERRLSDPQPRVTVIGECLNCGAPTIGQRNKRFCSRRCDKAAYARSHREAFANATRKRRATGKVRVSEAAAARRRLTRAAWVARNRERVRDYSRKAHKRHPERHRAAVRASNARNRDKRRAANREWRRRNPDKHAATQATRRARLLGGGGKHTSQQWQALVLEYQGRCAYCGVEGPLVRDHAIPVVLGGSNDISNIVPSCRACNQRKGRMLLEEFLSVMRLRDAS